MIGKRIKLHGGWNANSERCPICKFQCGYIESGVIIERYAVWHQKAGRYLPQADQWKVQLENGAITVGTIEQFEIVAE